MLREYADLISKSVGGLIMINPQCVMEAHLILDVKKQVERVQAHSENPTPVKSFDVDDQEQIGGAEAEETPYDAKNSPTQVQLVELLQFEQPQ